MHDFFQVPSEVTTVCILLFFVAIVWKYDRKSNRYAAPKKSDFLSKLLMVHLAGHYLVFLGTVIFINPEDMISIGLHEKIGNCSETVPVHTVLKVPHLTYSPLASGIDPIFVPFQTLQRRKYLCVDDYDEKYYDFHCLPGGKAPKDGSYWYTICGTPFE